MKAGKGPSVVRMCEMIGMSRASYYRCLEQDTSRQQEECGLRDEIEKVALEWPSYGSRRITEELKRLGREVGRERVQSVLRQESLLCLRQPTSWLITTQSAHSLPVFPNLVPEAKLTGVDQLWVADITYIRLRTEFVYLAAILDAFSRRVIGWALERTLEASLCVAALEKALRSRSVKPGLIHHSDQGVQYCSKEYVGILAQHNIVGSMARKGNPFDNAVAESFWKTLKYEQVYRHDYETLEQARASIHHFIESIYNHRRLHSSLGYLPPVEFEAKLVAQERS